MLTGLSLPALLEELAAPREVPGAGSALAVASATARASAAAVARGARELVAANLTALPGDMRVEEADRLVAAAAAAARTL